jgi:predicted nucleic acid-binding protein
MFLLDTVVLSELRRTRRDPGVASWLAKAEPSSLFLSVVAIGEIERGIARQRSADPAFALRLSDWLAGLVRLHAERVLPVTASIARRWGRLSAALGHDGADLLIAATALDHGLTVVTRDEAGFARTEVPVFNPFRGT